jgi:hypothetical protein
VEVLSQCSMSTLKKSTRNFTAICVSSIVNAYKTEFNCLFTSVKKLRIAIKNDDDCAEMEREKQIIGKWFCSRR